MTSVQHTSMARELIYRYTDWHDEKVKAKKAYIEVVDGLPVFIQPSSSDTLSSGAVYKADTATDVGATNATAVANSVDDGKR